LVGAEGAIALDAMRSRAIKMCVAAWIAQSDAIDPNADHVRLIVACGIFAAGVELTKMSIRHAVIALAMLLWAESAYAHGIACNRFFVGTITFADPAFAGEQHCPGTAPLQRFEFFFPADERSKDPSRRPQLPPFWIMF
jgi:hypothetical protein